MSFSRYASIFSHRRRMIWNRWVIVCLFLVVLQGILLSVHGIDIHFETSAGVDVQDDIMKELEANFFKGAGDLASKIFQNKMDLAPDSKKEIEIHCPGSEPPQVFVRELVEEQSDEEVTVNIDGEEETVEPSLKEKQCLSIKLTGSNFEMQMKVNC